MLFAQKLARKGFAAPNTATIKKLRDLTGSPLKDCIKALTETEGDMEKARDILKQKGLADAEKRVDRDAQEGLIGVRVSEDMATMVEVNCETDFVAKTDRFIGCTEIVLQSFHNRRDLMVGRDKMADREYIDKVINETALQMPKEPIGHGMDAEIKDLL